MEVVLAENICAQEGAVLTLEELEDVDLNLVDGIVVLVVHG